nr:gluconokinase [uncultured Celeribacter sp.]
MAIPEKIVVMGVSGAGKSTFGRVLAARLGAAWIEGDELHPPSNIAAMSQGRALTDARRAPWLARIGQEMERALENSGTVVVACSALKRRYRDQLRTQGPVYFIELDLDQARATARLHARAGHFMPESLVQSQFATLEPLQKDEWGCRLSATESVENSVFQLTERFGAL